MTNFFINGLGVYGRAIAKWLITSGLNASVHFNDSNYSGNTDQLAYLLNYDTWNMGSSFYTSGGFSIETSPDNKTYVSYNGRQFTLTFAESISDISAAAHESGYDTVYIDCTGKYLEADLVSLLGSPFTWVFAFPKSYNRNGQIYSYSTSGSLDNSSLVQIASPELMALSIALQGIGNNLSVSSINYNCFVSMGNSLFVQDSMRTASTGGNFSLGRSSLNVIQRFDGMVKLLGKTVPSFPTGITTGRSFYVPMARCGVLSLTITTNRTTTQEEINQMLNSFTSTTYVTSEASSYPVSSDVLNTNGFVLISKNGTQLMSISSGASITMDVIFDNTYKYIQMLCNEIYNAVQ